MNTTWRAHLGRLRHLGFGLTAVAALVIGCSGSAEVGATPQPTLLPQPPPADESATAVPDATAVPVATSVPTSTAVPDEPATVVPDPASTTSGEAEPDARPAFVDPPEELTSLIGTVYRDGLPQFDEHANITALGRGAIINTGDPDEEWRGLAYGLDGDRIPLAISAFTERSDEGEAIWRLTSVWMLHIEPTTTITIGNDVCKGESATHAFGQELFFVVTNAAQDTALGAWIITIDGPVPYPDFADLTCERFFP